MRKVLYISGTRADYGLMRHTLLAIRNSKDLDLDIAATGMHLMETHGLTIQEITSDGFVPHILDIINHTDSRDAMADFVGNCIQAITNVCKEIKPDIMLLLGDRGEMLAGAIAGAYLGLPVVHIHGGEVTSTIDESARHAITKLAHFHLPATEESAHRIVRMGENPDYVKVVGGPGLDKIDQDLMTREEVNQALNWDMPDPFVIVLQHPVSQEVNDSTIQIRNTLEAVKQSGLPAVIIYPNADAGGEAMIAEIETYHLEPTFRLFPHVNRTLFRSLMKHAALMIGNSSAGIIEAPSFYLPVVNIGSRQEGRQRGANVIDVSYAQDEIQNGIKKGLFDTDFLANLQHSVNPYGDGKAAERIVKYLKELVIDDALLQKKMMY